MFSFIFILLSHFRKKVKNLIPLLLLPYLSSKTMVSTNSCPKADRSLLVTLYLILLADS